jgi:hypothetical protein
MNRVQKKEEKRMVQKSRFRSERMDTNDKLSFSCTQWLGRHEELVNKTLPEAVRGLRTGEQLALLDPELLSWELQFMLARIMAASCRRIEWRLCARQPQYLIESVVRLCTPPKVECP